MFSFLMRVVACLVLAVGTVFAIGDIARSLSVHGLRLTSVSEAAAVLSLGDRIAPGSAGDTLLSVIGAWPVTPTLVALAFLLLLLFGRRRLQAVDLR